MVAEAARSLEGEVCLPNTRLRCLYLAVWMRQRPRGVAPSCRAGEGSHQTLRYRATLRFWKV